MMMMSAVGTPRFAGAAGLAVAVDALGAGAAVGTTGAGARLIICVYSLGPAAEGAEAAPPSAERGVEPPAEKIGGGSTEGPPNPAAATGDAWGVERGSGEGG